MKKNLTKVVLATLMATAPVMAFDTVSLFAVEGGYSNLSADVNQNGYTVQDSGMGNFGLKLGAEGENYRVFLSGRYFLAEEGNTVATAGAELQYKFNFSEPVDFFIGVNGGAAYLKAGPSDDGVLPSVSTTAPYMGGDVGFNFHATPEVDLELGIKYMHISDTVTQGSTTYDFNSISTAYASVIFKWQMN